MQPLLPFEFHYMQPFCFQKILLGHTEDALAEIKGHIYIVSAEILSDSDEKVVLEKFTTLCYAGTLMGYTMGYNSHGMIYSVNTIFPTVYTKGTRVYKNNKFSSIFFSF